MCNRYNIKNLIFNKVSCDDKSLSASESVLTDSSNWNEISTQNLSITSDENQENVIVIFLLREDFTNLIKEKVYKRQINKKRKTYYRLRKVLEPGKWQDLITDKFWQATRMKCAFQFKNHYISADTKSGVINGKLILTILLVIRCFEKKTITDFFN